MLRHFAAIIFVLTIAGNIWAGVCHCVEMSSKSASSCCKRPKIQGDAFSAKACCDELCGGAANLSVHRTHADSSNKIPAPNFVAALPSIPFNPVSSINEFLSPVSAEVDIGPAQLSRPPDLYLKHQAFLI
ncbi:hypothetical protein BH24ACI3_BH24ACI3_07550 [soil metagenome]